MRSNGIQLRTILQEIPQPSGTAISLKITYLKFCSNLPGANELNGWQGPVYLAVNTMAAEPWSHKTWQCPGDQFNIKREESIHYLFFLFFSKRVFILNRAQVSWTVSTIFQFRHQKGKYCQISNIRHTLVGNKIADHSDVVGASPLGAAPITSSCTT